MNLPQIFNSKAEFIEPADLTGLDAATLARLDGVRTASANLRTAQDAERAAVQAVTAGIEAAKAAEDYRKKHFPPSTPHDEWILNFGSPEARRKLMERK